MKNWIKRFFAIATLGCLSLLQTGCDTEVFQAILQLIDLSYSSRTYRVSVVDCASESSNGPIFIANDSVSRKFSKSMKDGVRKVADERSNFRIVNSIPQREYETFYKNVFGAQDMEQRCAYLRGICETYNTNLIVFGFMKPEDRNTGGGFGAWTYRQDRDSCSDGAFVEFEKGLSDRERESLVENTVKQVVNDSVEADDPWKEEKDSISTFIKAFGIGWTIGNALFSEGD